MGVLKGAYIYGSVGRNEADDRSDLDVLAIVENGSGMVDEKIIRNHLPEQFKDFKPSISWYGGKRIKEMFENGELFAWHLANESMPIYDPEKFLVSLGKPNPYREAAADISSFLRVLKDIPDQIKSCRANAVYEYGLVYVCLRNISMAASWCLCENPDFSRYSFANLQGVRGCPLSRERFDIAMTCRMASQRGLEIPPGVNAELVLSVYSELVPWVEEVLEAVNEVSR